MRKSFIFALAALALVCSCHVDSSLQENVAAGDKETLSPGTGGKDEPGDEPGDHPGDEPGDEPLNVYAITGAATALTSNKATLNGGVTISGADVSEATVFFLYSATENSVDGLVASGEKVSAMFGEEDGTFRPFCACLQGLASGTTYHFMAVVNVQDKTFRGVVRDFATIPTPEAVDLGLSVKWGSWNLGATKPEEYGDYYAWGETTPKAKYSFSTYAWGFERRVELGTISDGMTVFAIENLLIKYCPPEKVECWGGDGCPDNKTSLELEDDAAFALLGDGWRLPTAEEWHELFMNCTLTEATINGVRGYTMASRKVGFTSQWIFFPAAGRQDGSKSYDVGSVGDYWSSSLYSRWLPLDSSFDSLLDNNSDDPLMASYKRIDFDFFNDSMYSISILGGVRRIKRYNGLSVRPVAE